MEELLYKVKNTVPLRLCSNTNRNVLLRISLAARAPSFLHKSLERFLDAGAPKLKTDDGRSMRRHFTRSSSGIFLKHEKLSQVTRTDVDMYRSLVPLILLSPGTEKTGNYRTRFSTE